MSLLESVIGGVVGQVFGGQRAGAMSPLVKALLLLLLEKGAGGLLDHGGAPHPAGPAPGRPSAPDGGDIGGFGQSRGGRVPQPDVQPADAADSSLPPGDFSDLSGLLDGPGEAPISPAPTQAAQEAAGGLDALAESFQRSGLGHVMASWMGPGVNHPIAPDQLTEALGPDAIDFLQKQTGLEWATLLPQLTQALPVVVNALTSANSFSKTTDERPR